MMNYKKYYYMNPVNYTDEDLKKIYNDIQIEYSKHTEEWAREIKAVYDANPMIDPYSFWGGRKLNKVSKKYAGQIAEMEIILDVITKELARRDQYHEEQRYSGNSNFKYKEMGKEEFLDKEGLKTLAHKQKVE